MKKIENKIRDFIQENLIIFEEIEVKNTDNIFEKGFVNSLFAMKLLSYIEQEFSLIIENEELELKNFSSIENICNLIITKKQSSQI